MKIFIAILGFIAVLALVLFLGFIAAVVQAKMCEECPFKKECDAHQNDDDFIPECYKRRNTLSHNSIDNI